MYRFWTPVIGPALHALRPEVVVEVGADRGYGTALLAERARSQGFDLHVIDPDPKFDVADWRDRYGPRFLMHETPSLEALPSLERVDVALLDGDHNWYTALHELRRLGTVAQRQGFFPTVFLHDIGWPYGRRDLYYEPDRIPTEHRRPYVRGGLEPGRPEPSDDVAFNRHLANAVEEGGPANGVLTAVEDFMAEWSGDEELRLLTIPVIHGLGILYGARSAERHPAFGELLSELSSSQALRAVMEAAEGDRLQQLVQVAQLQGVDEQRREAERRARRAQRELGLLRSSRAVRLALAVATALAPLRQPYRVLRDLLAKLQGLRARAVGQRVRHREPRDAGAMAPADDRRAASVHPATPAATADVVVCVHNALDDVRACLDSIVAHTNLVRHSLIVVDDGSDAQTREHLVDFAAANPCLLVRHPDALGYTRAANAGIRASSAPFVVLLNSDTVVTPGWLDGLLRTALERPDAAVVGPLSNAASWQSIPHLTDDSGGWVVNPPPAEGIEAFAQRLARTSPSLAPRMPLVNGFCYLIARRALDEVGLLDEDAFPRGYGEEDDFSIRCQQAGFGLYLADDVYVYHAKSRSFTAEGRAAITPASKAALVRKHGRDALSTRVEQVQRSEGLLRARVWASLLAETTPRSQPVFSERQRLRVGWLQPHLQEAGGIRRVIEMANRLHRWGLPISVVTPDGSKPEWLPLAAPVVGFSAATDMMFDVLILSDPDMVEGFTAIPAKRRVKYHLGPYMLYRDADERLDAYYEDSDDSVHVANSTWTGEEVTERTGVPISAIFPGGVDKSLFRPVRAEVEHDIVAYGSPRRHKGADAVRQAASGLRLHELAPLKLPQRELARHFCSGRLFVSGCWHEGFNFMPLEAMACGVPVVMTDDGGSREYARHGQNALVVPVEDPPAMREAIDSALADQELRAGLIEEGLRTAWRYDWDTVTEQFAQFLLEL